MPLPIPHFADREAIDHARRWREHILAGRIGARLTQTPEQAERHARNHRILTGGAK